MGNNNIQMPKNKQITPTGVSDETITQITKPKQISITEIAKLKQKPISGITFEKETPRISPGCQTSDTIAGAVTGYNIRYTW